MDRVDANQEILRTAEEAGRKNFLAREQSASDENSTEIGSTTARFLIPAAVTSTPDCTRLPHGRWIDRSRPRPGPSSDSISAASATYR